MLDKRKFYINGSWVEPIQSRDMYVINPATEQSCAVISIGDSGDTNAAVSAARHAFTSWSQSSKADRLELLHALLAQYKLRAEDIAQAISMEMGAPIDLARIAQTGSGLFHIEGFIDAFSKMNFEHPISQDNLSEQIIHDPIGVCGLITPWNWPMNQVTLKAIPAMAAGCTLVLKPSEIAPLSSIVFSEIVDAAGFPAGVYNMINGDGVGVGSQLSSHPDIDMLSFTGSTRAGALITKSAADSVKRVTLELGGKGANIIFADADEQAVVRGVIHCFNNTGQSCNAPTRMLVERTVYDKAISTAIATAANVTAGDPMQQGPHIGPVVSEAQYQKIQQMIQVGIEEGARLIAGGLGKPEGFEQGYYVKPTIFADANNNMRVAREEIFGPVLVIIPFDSEEEAIAIANDTDYGLTNYLQTQDREKARRVSRHLRSGMVRVNGIDASAAAPFGGYKHSGNGREGGIWGLEDFLEIKHITDWY